jgi:hypothetical protein
VCGAGLDKISDREDKGSSNLPSIVQMSSLSGSVFSHSLISQLRRSRPLVQTKEISRDHCSNCQDFNFLEVLR